EVNTSHFELERGSDGNNFNKLVDIPTNNNSSSNTYSYIDNLPLPTGFYRLKLVDLDGTFKYSGILKINFTGIQKLEAFPNPVSNIITVSGINNNELVRLLSADGKVLLQKRASGQTMTIDISAFSSGFYILQYFDGTSIQTLKLVKK
ncbi:MAG TPA: T9SS type A sorting domain-containing protein, partial [Chitinophagaceae bacterium]|nr:T9SS type A sorting domain-containing protein [Chitinophagaceae bacterium]